MNSLSEETRMVFPTGIHGFMLGHRRHLFQAQMNRVNPVELDGRLGCQVPRE